MWSMQHRPHDAEIPAWTLDRAEHLRRVADERRLAKLIRCSTQRRRA